MNIDIDNFKLIVETIKHPKEVLIDLKSKLDEEKDSLQSSYDYDKFECDKRDLEVIKLKLQVVQGLTNKVNNGY